MNGRLIERFMILWITLQEVLFKNVVNFLYLIGTEYLNLHPEIEAEGIQWRFLGIFAKNREEWTVADLACMRNSVTIVPFFYSLGAEALTFVINQTELTTMCVEKG